MKAEPRLRIIGPSAEQFATCYYRMLPDLHFRDAHRACAPTTGSTDKLADVRPAEDRPRRTTSRRPMRHLSAIRLYAMGNRQAGSNTLAEQGWTAIRRQAG